MDPDPGKEIEVDPDPDPRRGLKWIRIRNAGIKDIQGIKLRYTVDMVKDLQCRDGYMSNGHRRRLLFYYY